MFHLNRWNQHQLYFESSCDYQCLGCNIPEASTISAKQVIQQSQKHDILNIYGGNPALNESLLEYCQYFKHHERIIRLWTNHLGIRGLSDAIKKLIDEWVFYCPSPDKDQFNASCGGEYFDFFISDINHLKAKKTISFYIRPLSFDILPDCYDMITELNAYGMVLYQPHEFNQEEKSYINRFKRVNNMMVFKAKPTLQQYCFSVPNTIGTLKFEWVEWQFYAKQSVMKLPIMKLFS